MLRRLIAVESDEKFLLYEGDTVTWAREEARASVKAALFLDLPAPSPELAAQARAAAPSLSERLRAEFLALKASVAQCIALTEARAAPKDSENWMRAAPASPSGVLF